ncbi:tryptophan dimethylallyltransferase-domain-containing protein [Apiosordaria backusii]|uniref:Tryptophan dimethylallyltransferase-domain-containing protein n=1 Tax=Apiosordaria backusii TaxID=314023 RepID=A0AA40EI50_9PEZI|nr:tryptophan dimethylallyltransferase-domain-containing protein [Apiosordaria backusii]
MEVARSFFTPTADFKRGHNDLVPSSYQQQYGRRQPSQTARFDLSLYGLGADTLIGHAAMWNMRLGDQLSRLMQMAGYSKDSQAIHRAFFAENVAPALGPCPDGTTTMPQWPSFMTDDHTPVEFSWAWSEKSSTPCVRYSAEPIGWLAGSDADPLNTKATIGLLGRTLPLAPNLDLYWYRHLLGALTTNTPTSSHHPLSQTFTAFDLERDSMTVKYYFLPTHKALSLGKSNLELAEDAILALPSPCRTDLNGFESPLRTVTDFIRSHPTPSQPTVEIVAVDCVDPALSRIKIYVRSRETTFDSVVRMLTLGGGLPPLSEDARSSLVELWCGVFGVSDTKEQLSAKNHRTAGILYYYELKAGGKVGAKVYLPVRHYGKSDEQIARGLSGYLTKRGKGLNGGMSYYDGVAALCGNRTRLSRLGFHTYITCAVKGNDLNINAYFNPQVYCSTS